MPITLTFDLEEETIADTNDRTRLTLNFKRLGWEHIGGSAWRYPALGTENTSEDWFNHVIPALMYFRSLVTRKKIRVYNFTLDAHSEAGHRGKANPMLGEPIRDAAGITMYPTGLKKVYNDKLTEERLRKFIDSCTDAT